MSTTNTELLSLCNQVTEIEEGFEPAEGRMSPDPWKSVWRLFSFAESISGWRSISKDRISLSTAEDRLAAIGIVSWISDVATRIEQRHPDHHYSADPTDFSDESRPSAKITRLLRSLLSDAVHPYFDAINAAEKQGVAFPSPIGDYA